MKKVLIVKTSSMGDLIHTLPALTDARENCSDICFDWVAEKAFAEIPTWHPTVRRVIPINMRYWRRYPIKTLVAGEWSNYKQQLQQTNYDKIIDAQGLLKSAFFSVRLAKGVSYGMGRNSAREGIAAKFYTHKFYIDKAQHAVERTRQLFAYALDYELPETKGDYGIYQQFKPSTESSQPYLVLIHSSSRSDKLWPEPYWQDLIAKASAAGWKIKIVWGNTTEYNRSLKLAQASTSTEVMPHLNLTDMARVIAGAAASISVDTGLSHLAAALNIPNIMLFNSTNPKLVGGYGQNQYCLEASKYPAVNTEVTPASFAALTPDIVWNKLEEAIKKRHKISSQK